MNNKASFFLLILLISCQQLSTNISSKNTEVQLSTLSVVDTQKTVNITKDLINEPTTCQTTGMLIEQFEQNNAKFERFKNKEEDLQWLRVTTKNDNCSIIDSIEVGNQHRSSFEDWDKDGFKDRIHSLKWTYQVYLFNKQKNDFSREIKGDFNGEQYDFDKKRNLKFQFLEDKFGGNYQLYELKDTAFTILSEVRFQRDDDDDRTKSKIQIRKNIVRSKAGMTCDTLKNDSDLYTKLQEKKGEELEEWIKRTKNIVEIYWRANLSFFIKN